jgi:hypothetical protein
MPSRALVPILVAGLTAACATPVSQAPSLAPRAAEAIDPRLPVGGESPAVGPADPALVARLGELVGRAAEGDRAFQPAMDAAERLAAAAGPSQSESWVAAQQALSAAVAARAPTTRAIGDIDALAAANLTARQWIGPADLAAIEAAAEQAGAIERRQAERITAVQARLGA